MEQAKMLIVQCITPTEGRKKGKTMIKYVCNGCGRESQSELYKVVVDFPTYASGNSSRRYDFCATCLDDLDIKGYKRKPPKKAKNHPMKWTKLTIDPPAEGKKKQK